MIFLTPSNLRCALYAKINYAHFSIKKCIFSPFILFFCSYVVRSVCFLSLYGARLYHNWRGKKASACVCVCCSIDTALKIVVWVPIVEMVKIHLFMRTWQWYNWIICFTKWFMEKWFKFWPTLCIQRLSSFFLLRMEIVCFCIKSNLFFSDTFFSIRFFLHA